MGSPPMNTRCHRRIRRAKLKGRSELDIFQWNKHNFATEDFSGSEGSRRLDNLTRVDYKTTSREEFVLKYEEPSLPVVIQGVMEEDGWSACQNWNVETFLKKYYNQPFKVGEDDDGNNVYVKMKYFLKYATTDGLLDDSPLYIFDSGFVKRKLTAVQRKRMNGSSSSSSSSSTSSRVSSRSGSADDLPSTIATGTLGTKSLPLSSLSNELSSNGMKRNRQSSDSSSSGRNGGSDMKQSSRKPKKKMVRRAGRRDADDSDSDDSQDEGVGLSSGNGNGNHHNNNGNNNNGTSNGKEKIVDIFKLKRSKKDEEHASTLLEDFKVPKFFKDDLFQLAGDRRRPPYRWFVVGGARSGTGIHIDPLGTSAWNTLTTGHKRWCLFPPGTPKSVYDPPMKPFDREAVSWFHHVYPRFSANNFELATRYKMVEVVQGPGETMFVPGGWPHIVMNLDFTIAITQNFCSATNFETVWLQTRHGRPKLAQKFRKEIERLFRKTGKCFYGDLAEKCLHLETVPMLYRSSDSSSSSSSSSSSDGGSSSSVVTGSSTESESDIGEICMCHKCKKKRRKEVRRAEKEKVKAEKAEKEKEKDKGQKEHKDGNRDGEVNGKGKEKEKSKDKDRS